jgi:tetratricopeptide (TPR) repeat protein
LPIHSLGAAELVWGHYNRAEVLFKKAISGLEKASGSTNRYTVMGNLAECLSLQGKYDEAPGLARKTLAEMENVLHPEDSSLLMSMNHLGIILFRTGDFEELLKMLERAYASQMKVFGPNNKSTIETIHVIGLVYGQKGEFDKALEWIWAGSGGRGQDIWAGASVPVDTSLQQSFVSGTRGSYP